jgi:uncharacterized protein YukE
MGETTSDLWDLRADPAALDSLEGLWKSQARQLSSAADIVDRAASRVLGGEAWTGDTAERYDSHRRTLVADLDACAELANTVARALGACADTLRYNQNLLDAERRKLAHVPCSDAGGTLTFHPADAEQTALVREAIATAQAIRSRVDQQLNAQASVFNAALGQLQGWQGRWSARTLRMLNYNIQQGGKGNHWLNRKPGHDHGDFGELAQRIIDGDVDIATLQEVFRSGAEELERELNKRAAPGERWEVHFGKASQKHYASNGGIPVLPGLNEDFGNAVVVRTGRGVRTGAPRVHDLGPGDEGRSTTQVPIFVD